jgi:hypothetical protein
MLIYSQLPFVDEHSVAAAGEPEQVWDAVRRSAPSTGFHVTESDPPRKLVLEGSHPFSRYALVFLVEPAPGGGSRVRAQTWADFPGPQGRVYRALVIGSRLHVVAVRRMLRRVAG